MSRYIRWFVCEVLFMEDHSCIQFIGISEDEKGVEKVENIFSDVYLFGKQYFFFKYVEFFQNIPLVFSHEPCSSSLKDSEIPFVNSFYQFTRRWIYTDFYGSELWCISSRTWIKVNRHTIHAGICGILLWVSVLHNMYDFVVVFVGRTL